MEEFTITSNHDDLDFELIHRFIASSYWAKGIPKPTLKKSIDNSLVFGAYSQSGQQVAFARVITDKATFAYLADVFTLESHRGLGISKKLMQSISQHPDLQGLRKFMLTTKDAHGLYAQFGFEVVDQPERLMQILKPEIYKQNC